MTQAKRGMTTTLAIGVTTIGELTNISSPAMTRDTNDVTNLSSADNYREFIAGIKDGGEVTYSGNFVPGDAGQIAVLAAFEAGSTDTYTITFPTAMGATFTFSGINTSYQPGEANIDDPLTFEITLKITGKPALGVTASTGLSDLSLTGTGGVLTPAFAIGKFNYSWTFNTLASITVTPTGTDHTIKLYVDGVYIEDVATTVASSAIAIAASGSKQIDLVCFESGKTAKTYTVIAASTD